MAMRLGLEILFGLLFLKTVLSIDHISIDDCKTTKSCIFVPEGCESSISNCHSGVTYRKNGDYIDFELLAKLPPSNGQRPQYAAVAFSDDQSMGNDAVTACIYTPSTGKVGASLSYNPGKSNQAITDKAVLDSQLRGVSGSYVNGTLMCRFSQKIQPPAAPAFNQQIFPLDKPYYLLYASGPAKDGQTLDIHSTDESSEFFPRSLRSAKVSFDSSASDTRSATGSGADGQQAPAPAGRPAWKRLLVLSHGILMIFGWWLLVAVAILFARYFKSMLPGRQLCGLDSWFHFHRGLNLIGVLAIAAAFVCIFVAKDGQWIGNGRSYDDPGHIHAIVGMTASIGAFLQPILAVFRCDKFSSKRPIFNWVHRIIGLGSWACASAAIWFATTFYDSLTEQGHYTQAPRGLIIFYWVALGVVAIALEVWITVSERIKSRAAVATDIQLRTINGKTVETTVTPANKYGIIRGILLVFFILVAVSVTVALACFIALPNGL